MRLLVAAAASLVLVLPPHLTSAQIEPSIDFDKLFELAEDMPKRLRVVAEYDRKLGQHLERNLFRVLEFCEKETSAPSSFRSLFIIQEDLSYALYVKPLNEFTQCVRLVLPKVEPKAPQPPTAPFMNAFEYRHEPR